MNKILLSLLLLSTHAMASDFYYKCQSQLSPDRKIELDINLIRGTWMSVKGISKYWTHLMLVKVNPNSLIFEVRESGEGEASFIQSEAPQGFITGEQNGSIFIYDIFNPADREEYSCERSLINEDKKDSPISFNVKGLWYRGRIPENKIAYIDDINTRLNSNYSANEIVTDINSNGCKSPFIQASVSAMLRVFGPSRKVSIREIEISRTETLSFEDSPCLYEWRGGSTGVVCYGNICVKGSDH